MKASRFSDAQKAFISFSRFSPALKPLRLLRHTSSRCWKESGEKWDCRQRHGSTKGAEFVLRDVELWAYQRGVTKPSR